MESAAAEGNGCSLPMCLPPEFFFLLFSTVKPQADQEKLHGMIACGVTSPVWHFRLILNNHTFSPAIFNEADADIFKTRGRRVSNTCGTAHALQELLYSNYFLALITDILIVTTENARNGKQEQPQPQQQTDCICARKVELHVERS